MGVTLGKSGANETQAALKFRRAVATVQVLNRTEKDSRRKKLPEIQVEPAGNNSNLQPAKNHLTTFDDNEDAASVHGFIYKDTSDAWASLRAGHVPEVTATDKEFSVVDSALTGYRAVERVRVSDETEESLVCGDTKDDDDTFDVPYEPPGGWDAPKSTRIRCSSCKKGGGILHECRICENAYHESCLTKVGRLPDAESKVFFMKALTNTGWSCHDCESLGSMLHQDDMVELIEVFDKADIDDDATIDLDEFIKYRRWVVREREDRELTEDEAGDETIQFRAMDTDRTGTLSWWEFLDHEALRRLASKQPKQLVKLLSEKEIAKARDNFRAFDTDGDGTITEYEARRAYKRWYAHFVPDPADMSPSESDDEVDEDAEILLRKAAATRRRRLSMATDTQRSRQLHTHIHANTQLLMGADRDNSGTISWEEYLCEQALYIIAARPNVGPVHLKNRKPSFAH